MLGARWALTAFGTALLAGLALAAACGDDDNGGGRVEHTTGMTAWQGKEVVVTAKDISFEPEELRVKAQNRYMLHLVNEGKQPHDWTIDAIPVTEVRAVESAEHETGEMATPMSGSGMMRLHIAADRGEDRHMSFMPMEKGEYVFYCTVPGHRSAGMEGKLVVE